ncbi:MAG TPA: hypothetical protein VFS77_03360 [Pyrinomonadaceae bacterium]|nr:hypothetical protein [Pyrinomonadaceae bacterium]
MKQMALMFLLFVAVVSMADYNDTVNGSQTAAPEAQGIALNLTASGDLPGMSKLMLQRDGTNVTGGTWRLTVLPQNADASSSERGNLDGTVTGGTLTLNAEGTVSAASSVQITIQSGTGDYASVSTGTATLNLSADAENPTQLTGTLVLSF